MSVYGGEILHELQKASMWKRISAALCDLILLAVAAAGFAILFSAATGYDGHAQHLQDISERYEAEYGVDFQISNQDYEKLTDAERDNYKAAFEAFSKDSEANQVYGMLVNLSFLIITFGILIACVLLELFVPLILKNGQTLGKKIFGVAVMRRDGIRISPIVLFTRVILGKYTVEIMIPVLLVLMIYWNMIGILGTVALFALLILQIVLLISSEERPVLHDKLAHTVAVDFASQMIFDTPEQKEEYKKRILADIAETDKN